MKTDHEYKIVSKGEKKSSRVPQEASRTPLWRPKMSPERAQDVSRTPPRRLQIASRARLLLISPSGPQKYPQMVSNNASRRLKNAPMRGATQTSKRKEKNSETDRKIVRQANNQQTNTRTNRPTDLQKEIERQTRTYTASRKTRKET